MICHLCQKRRAQRACPAARGSICSVCCATEREQTLRCPYECQYLQQARETDPQRDDFEFPDPDIVLDPDFLEREFPVIAIVGWQLAAAAQEEPDALDGDMRQALESLVTTYRTRVKGLYYDARPTNPIAASIVAIVRQAIDRLLDKMPDRVKADAALRSLVYLRRHAAAVDNQRRYGRPFLHYLHDFFWADDVIGAAAAKLMSEEDEDDYEEPRLIVPGV